MPSIKISYFDIRGRAEPLRLACVVGGIEFEDHRFDYKDFADFKKTTPYGSVPTMELDGKMMAQSAGILRYLGKLGNLYPENPEKALFVDEIIDTMADFQQCVFRYRGDDKEKLRAERIKLAENDIPRYFGGAQKRIDEMGGPGPWVIGSEITIADLVVANVFNSFKCGILDYVPADALDAFSRMVEVYNAVMAHPKVAEWYKKRPIKNVSVPVSA